MWMYKIKSTNHKFVLSSQNKHGLIPVVCQSDCIPWDVWHVISQLARKGYQIHERIVCDEFLFLKVLIIYMEGWIPKLIFKLHWPK